MEISATTDQTRDETINKDLFDNVMNNEWDAVVETYERDSSAHKAKITSSGETALHLAVEYVQREIVEKLVQLIKREDPAEAKQVLELRNFRGRTPLHFAAAVGDKRICQCIATVDKSLVLARDGSGMTPIFRAVQYSRRTAFLYLYSVLQEAVVNQEELYSCCRRYDGQTILHDAVIRENFDLAIMIIQRYKDLVNFVDKEGESPLHALARKPAAFESGNYHRGLDRIIYNSISAEELRAQSLKRLESKQGLTDEEDPTQSKHYPSVPNSFGILLRNATRIVTCTRHAKQDSPSADIENQLEGHTVSKSFNYSKNQSIPEAQENRWLPANCTFSCFNKYFTTLARKGMLIVFGYRNKTIMKLRKEKEKRGWAVELLDEILKHAIMYEKDNKGRRLRGVWQTKNETTERFNESLGDDTSEDLLGDQEFGDDKSTINKSDQQSITSGTVQEDENSKKEKKETALLIAAKYGIVEIVEKILIRFPVAVFDSNIDQKSVLLVAVENRHLQVYRLLIKNYHRKSVIFQEMDKNRNTALHFAAMYKDNQSLKPWPVPGAALQMQWEIKWYEYVENTMPPHLFLRNNSEGRTPKELFTYDHSHLVKGGGKWLTNTATSCSVVATLIATVAFASSSTVPGGTDTKTGKPNLKQSPTFQLFAISSLVALCFSVTSLITFLAILTSRHQEKDFGKDLPRKILLGLTSLFVSIASILVTFCVSHFLVFEDKINYAAFPVYAVTLLPLCLFAAAQFSLYFDIFRATFWSPFA